jgi:hypothetical protein
VAEGLGLVEPARAASAAAAALHDPRAKPRRVEACLLRAIEGEGALAQLIADTLEELRICMFGAGAGNAAALRGRLEPAESAA